MMNGSLVPPRGGLLGRILRGFAKPKGDLRESQWAEITLAQAKVHELERRLLFAERGSKRFMIREAAYARHWRGPADQ